MAQQPKSYKKFVATAATATLVASAIVPVASANVTTAAFTDVPASYTDAVNFVVENNIAKGLDEKQFGISMKIKRGDVAIMIANAAGLNDEKAASAGFSDVPKRGALAVNSLKAAGVISGKTATKFGFDDNVTRGEAALMLQKAFELKAGDTKNDFSDVSDRYDAAVDALVANDVTNGINKTQFGTQNPIKRGDFAKFLYALKEMIDTEKPSPETPEVDGNQLILSSAKSSITADGGDNTVITAKIVDENGNVAKDADDLVLKFDATYGQLANNRVTVQDGVATVVLTSEFSKTALESIVTARLIEAAPDSKWSKDIGKLVNTTTVKFTPASGTVSETALITGAESNQADRLTVFFDKDVTPASFLTDKNPLNLTVNQTNNKTIVGYKAVPNNSKAIEVILAKTTPLANNKTVTVGQVTKENTVNTREFILTDARQPEATSVVQNAYNELEVTFSEPIQDVQKSQLLIDGGTVTIKSVVNGEFNQDLGDKRNKLIVTTDKYIKSGKHSIQLSGIKDFANNESTNQILDFNVQGSDVVPAATAVVESPEQVRVEFNTFVEGFKPADLKLEVYNEDSKEWVPAVAGAVDNLKKTPQWNVTSNAQDVTYKQNVEYLYELTEDWTELFDTKNTNDNYYNHKFRLALDKDKVENPANEKKNFKQEIDLSYSGSALANTDTNSPKLVGTPTQVVENKINMFDVRFDKPVKDRDLDPGLNTPSQLQGTTIPKVVVEFIGTDKDGKKITVDGSVVKYSDKMENGFLVKPVKDLQTQVDEAGFAEDWELVVRNVTDDVGNAASTLTQKFTVSKSPSATDFAVKKGEYDGVDFYLNGADEDQVVLKFTSAVQYTGNTENALNASNYTLNGKELPKGTKFTLADTNNNEKDGYEQVTITLPEGTLNGSTNVINLSKGLKSSLGVTISGMTEIAKAPKDKAPGTDVADKTVLNNAIAAADKVVKGDYTDATWTAFQTALTNAKATAADKTATSAKVAADTAALTKAQDELAKKGEASMTFGSLDADATIKLDGLGSKVVGFNSAKLPEDMKGTSYTLTIDGTVYNFKVNSFDKDRYTIVVDQNVSDDLINAGILKSAK